MKVLLHPGSYYHVYAHAVGSDNAFRHHDDFIRFITTMPYYVHFLCDVYAYCLMPNHVHLVVRICHRHEMLSRLDLDNKERISYVIKTNTCTDEELARFASVSMGRLFSSHALYMNRKYGRMGNLFMSNFKRKAILTDDYFRNVIRYVHANPVNHGFASDLNQWMYSSYFNYRSNGHSMSPQHPAMALFGGYRSFIRFHQENPRSNGFIPALN